MWRWDQQEPFGINLPDENPSGLGAFDLPLRLPGQYFDKETNLNYNYFRDYDPSLGIYKQFDPIGLRGGINGYRYVAGKPLASSDFFGLAETGKGFSTRYGNWCGKDYSGGVASHLIPVNPAAPVDSLDECCMSHDYCTARFECPKGCMAEKEREPGKQACDDVLAGCLDKLKAPRTWPKPTPSGQEADAHFYCQKAKVLYRK